MLLESFQMFPINSNSSRKLAQMSDCGKTQIVKILKQKATILELWNSNEET